MPLLPLTSPPPIPSRAASEVLAFSDVVVKINRKDKPQERILVVTDRALYNLNKARKMKRRIALGAIAGLTASLLSDEFVIHVPAEYDYRISAQRKAELVECISAARQRLLGAPLLIHDSGDTSLKTVTVTRMHAAPGALLPPPLHPGGGGAAAAARAYLHAGGRGLSAVTEEDDDGAASHREASSDRLGGGGPPSPAASAAAAYYSSSSSSSSHPAVSRRGGEAPLLSFESSHPQGALGGGLPPGVAYGSLALRSATPSPVPPSHALAGGGGNIDSFPLTSASLSSSSGGHALQPTALPAAFSRVEAFVDETAPRGGGASASFYGGSGTSSAPLRAGASSGRGVGGGDHAHAAATAAAAAAAAGGGGGGGVDRYHVEADALYGLRDDYAGLGHSYSYRGGAGPLAATIVDQQQHAEPPQTSHPSSSGGGGSGGGPAASHAPPAGGSGKGVAASAATPAGTGGRRGGFVEEAEEGDDESELQAASLVYAASHQPASMLQQHHHHHHQLDAHAFRRDDDASSSGALSPPPTAAGGHHHHHLQPHALSAAAFGYGSSPQSPAELGSFSAGAGDAAEAAAISSGGGGGGGGNSFFQLGGAGFPQHQHHLHHHHGGAAAAGAGGPGGGGASSQPLRAPSPVAPAAAAAQLPPVTGWSRHESPVGLESFELLRVIGRGSYGKVLQVRKRDSGEVFAMKVLSKALVVRRNQVEHTQAERAILESIDHPFLIKLRYAFQTPAKLYLVLPYLRGGEVFYHLKQKRRLELPLARFYIAEIVLGVGHLHAVGIVYR